MVKINAERLFQFGFIFLFFRQPLQYFSGKSYLILFALGLFICAISLAFNIKKINFSGNDLFLALIVFAVFLLHLLLALVGSDRSVARPLWVAGVAQLLLVFLFLYYKNSPRLWSFLKSSIVIGLIIEFTLAFLQLSYYSTGIGLPPVADEYENFSFVSGSFFNANDFSVYVAACAMALYAYLSMAQKRNQAYLTVALAAIAVFVSLSRTAFVFMSLFVVCVFVGAFRDSLRAPLKKGNPTTLAVLFLISIGVVYFLSTQFLTTTSVFDRSIDRISQIGQASTDESVSTRLLVYTRLLENLPNLWIGTFSDQNYAAFFSPNDLELMQFNPHSFLAEMSFLYGWLGFVLSIGLILLIVIGIIKNRDVPLFLRMIASLSLIFFQSVPSSILANGLFFLPYFFLMYCRKEMVQVKKINTPKSSRVAVS